MSSIGRKQTCRTIEVILKMAGKRQHFIPRFMQIGFANEKNQTWVYPKESKKYKSNINNVGVETYFYSHQDDNEADDLITEAERSFSSTIKSFRESNQQPPARQIAEMIAHFEVRTRNLRKSFLDATDYLITKMFEKLSDEEFLKKLVIRRIRKDPSVLKSEIKKVLPKTGFLKFFLWPITKLVQLLAPSLIEKNFSSVTPLIQQLKSKLPETLKIASKSGHIRALKQSVSPKTRMDRYKDIKFEKIEIPEGNLILGDSIVFFNTEEKGYCTFLDKDQTLKEVFMPINSKKVLIGFSKEFTTPFCSLNEIIAQCSLEFFIAKDESPSNDLLKAEIGKKAEIISSEEIEEILFESLQG
jgi:hypothetical protein